ncbi:MAG: hypothetical protein ACLUHE_05410 [Christensenellales bacterium]
MIFNSYAFLAFFPIVTLAYYLMPMRARRPWLLAASYYFYMCWSNGSLPLLCQALWQARRSLAALWRAWADQGQKRGQRAGFWRSTRTISLERRNERQQIFWILPIQSRESPRVLVDAG